MNLVLGLFLTIFYFGLLPTSYGSESHPILSAEDERFHAPDFSSLNIRLGVRPIAPPEHLVKRTVLLDTVLKDVPIPEGGVHTAIIEDGAGRQVLILSVPAKQEPNVPIQVYLLYDFDLESHIPVLQQFARERQCGQGAQEQQGETRGLACIALCMVQALHPSTS